MCYNIENNEISDLMLYALGFKDSETFAEMMKATMIDEW